MSTPDIRVRLSPEGIKEVIAGLRAVQAEANKSNKSAAGGLGLVNNALRDLKALAPAIGLAAVVGGFVALAKQALDTADATGKLQQKVGGTVEEISGLTLAFKTNESDQAGLQAALLKTANVLAQVRANAPEAVQALEAIGVNAQEVAQQSTPRALESIASALQKIPPGAERAAATFAIFGKQSGDLVTALDAVGRDGIDAFIAKARELGVLIDGDLAQAAAAAKDSLGLIKIEAQGLATQFIAGLAPAVASAMEEFSKAVSGEGLNGMREFGKGVGFVIRQIVNFFINLGDEIGAQLAKIASRFDQFAAQSKAFASGEFKQILVLEAQGEADRAAIDQALGQRIAARNERAFEGPQPGKPRPAAGTETVLPPVDKTAKDIAAARLAFIRAQLQNELKIFQEGGKLADQVNKDAYDQGLISLQQYFDARRQVLQANQAKELQVLRAERAALAAELKASTSPANAGAQRGEIVNRIRNVGFVADSPEAQLKLQGQLKQQLAAFDATAAKTDADRLKLRQQLAEVDTKILAQEISGQRELTSLAGEQVAAQKEVDAARRQAASQLAQAEGDRHAVFLANLEEEIRGLKELGAKAGLSVDEVEAHIKRLTVAREAQFNFEEVARKGQAAMDSFTRDAELIARDQQAGITTQLEGQQRLIELEGKRLEQLKLLAAELVTAAEKSGDLENIQKAREFSDSVNQIGVSYRGATDEIVKFKTAGKEAIQEGLEGLFANIDKIKSVGDAFESLANVVAQALLRMAAQILAQKAVLALFGGAAGAPATGKDGGVVVQKKAAGDIVSGPGLNIPGRDTVPALLEPGEFVMRKAAVQRPGALAFLRHFNRGSLRAAMPIARFADGGLVGVGGAGGAGARMIQQNITVQADKQGAVSRLTLQQTAAAAARGLTEANRRDN